jgi:aconitate hydratase
MNPNPVPPQPFPIDEVTVDYLRLTGRTDDLLALVEAYAKAQGMWHDAERTPVFSEYIDLDLVDVVPSIDGPKHPQDRVLLSESYLVLTSRGRNRTAHRQCLPPAR